MERKLPGDVREEGEERIVELQVAVTNSVYPFSISTCSDRLDVNRIPLQLSTT